MPEHSSTSIQTEDISPNEWFISGSSEFVSGEIKRRAARVGSVSLIITILAAIIGAHSRTLSAPQDAQNVSVSADASTLVTVNPSSGGQVMMNPAVSVSSSPIEPTPAMLPNVHTKPENAFFEHSVTIQNDVSISDADTTTRTIPIGYQKVIRLSRLDEPGETKVLTYGEDGVLQKTFAVSYGRHHEANYRFVSQRTIKNPVNEIVEAGYTSRDSQVLPSRSGVYNRSEELDLVATGYAPSEGPGHGYCKTGMRAGYGVVAVDPRLIPLHSALYISGYGYAVAGDTGGAIKGHRIDLGQNTRYAANAVGRRHVHVYILSRQ